MSPLAPTNPKEGGCLCGALRYRIASDAFALTACHCTDCQRSTGSAFGMSLIMPKTGFELIRGEPRVFVKTFEEDGRRKFNKFCGECGARIVTEFSHIPQIANVKPGTLDDTSWLRPVAHIWRRSAQRWVPVPDGVLCYEKQPADFSAVIKAWAEQSGK